MSEFSEFMRALEIGIAIGKRSAGQFLLGVTMCPELLDPDELRKIGREWTDEGQAEMDRLSRHKVVDRG